MKPTTNKKVLFWVLLWCGLAASVIIYGWFKEVPNAVGMLSVIATVATLVIGSYVWKAKAENVLKISRDEKISEDILKQLIAMQAEATSITTARDDDVSG